MSNDQIQDALVNLVSSFEELQKGLEIKHLWSEVEEDTDIESLPPEKLEAMDDEFHQAMVLTMENISANDLVDITDIGAVASILLDTVEEVAPQLFEDTGEEMEV